MSKTEDISQVGDWQKISDLGSGAFGIVSLWRNIRSEDFVAIKKCKFHLNSHVTPKQRERWKNEVEIMKHINHPNIIRYKHIPAELEKALLKRNSTQLPLLPMEYCRQGNLRRLLTKFNNVSGLEEQDIRYILEDLSSGLEHLHKLKITHRDIKPDNIVLQYCEQRPGNTIYKIIDLGYAKELTDSTQSFVGTLHYLAPEIFFAENYNKSVDYWSLGVLTFEIICGVLPFLPHLTPVERFVKIKDKGIDDICIYLNYSGHVTNSREIKKENFISSCFKQNIEVWLRHVLQYDHEVRSQPFANGVSIFTYLQNILSKCIINIVSLYKMEMYSYEINVSTMSSTLKDWICRDIKAYKHDVILMLPSGRVLNHDDDQLLIMDFLGKENIIYVIKKYTLVTIPIQYKFPKLVREALTSAQRFDKKYLKALYAQMMYFVKSEKNTADHFRTGFNLYLIYLTYSFNMLNGAIVDSSKAMEKLLNKVECYNKIRKNENVCDSKLLSDNGDYRDCLNCNQRLVACLERRIKSHEELKRKLAVILKRKNIVENYAADMREICNKYDFSELYVRAINILDKPDQKKPFIKAVTSLISESIRCKDNLFSNKHFGAFLSAVAILLNQIDKLLMWTKDFDAHITELSTAMEKNEMIYCNIVRNAPKTPSLSKKKNSGLTGAEGDLLQLSSLNLTKDNLRIRTLFDELISKSISAHQNYVKFLDF